MVKYGGSLFGGETLRSVQDSGKLPAYPCPNPTLTLLSYLKQNIGLESRGFSQGFIWLFVLQIQMQKKTESDTFQ